MSWCRRQKKKRKRLTSGEGTARPQSSDLPKNTLALHRSSRPGARGEKSPRENKFKKKSERKGEKRRIKSTPKRRTKSAQPSRVGRQHGGASRHGATKATKSTTARFTSLQRGSPGHTNHQTPRQTTTDGVVARHGLSTPLSVTSARARKGGPQPTRRRSHHPGQPRARTHRSNEHRPRARERSPRQLAREQRACVAGEEDGGEAPQIFFYLAPMQQAELAFLADALGGDDIAIESLVATAEVAAIDLKHSRQQVASSLHVL